jgi:hypothetical protein
MKMKYFPIYIISFLVLLTSCDWTEFDKLSEDATVQLINSPNTFQGTNFGQVVSPVYQTGSQIQPGVFIVGGGGQFPFAIIRLSPDGIKTEAIGFENNRNFNPISSMIPVESADATWNVLTASKQFQTVSLISIDHTNNIIQESLTFDGSRYEGFGISIGSMNTGDNQRFLIASNDNLFITNDSTLQSIALPPDFIINNPQIEYSHISILETITRNGSDYIVVGGMNSTNSFWEVLMIPYESDLQNIDEPGRIRLSGSEIYSGERVYSLLVENVHGDIEKDLVIGTGSNIYIYSSFDATGNLEPNITLTANSTDIHIGKVLGKGKLTAGNTIELIAADPDYSNNNSSLGIVAIFTTPVTSSTPVRLLTPPENEQKFGSSLITIPFETAINRVELIIGGLNTSYLHFITGISGDNDPETDDPR